MLCIHPLPPNLTIVLLKPGTAISPSEMNGRFSCRVETYRYGEDLLTIAACGVADAYRAAHGIMYDLGSPSVDCHVGITALGTGEGLLAAIARAHEMLSRAATLGFAISMIVEDCDDDQGPEAPE